MLIEGQEDREKRFKAMLQYLILREACNFDDEFSRVDSGAGVGGGSEVQINKDKFNAESAKKILKEMKLKFFDFFVEDVVENNFLVEDFDKERDKIEKLIKKQIEKIQLLKTADKEHASIEKDLKKIFQSSKIENLIMVCDLPSDPKDTYLTALVNSNNSNLILDIDNVFNSSNLASITYNALFKIRDNFLSEPENELCKIAETFTAIRANIATITAIGCGLINLIGKIINKSFVSEQDSESEGENSPVTPSKSVRGEKILGIVNSLNPSFGYV